jgi:lipopolysaccharide/colanic/teichoic acid biosynthesis glycosyltransferase
MRDPPVDEPRLSLSGRELRVRIFDVLISLTALALLWPIMVLAVAAIFLDSGAPILFRQRRLGQHGRIFQILKFRKFAPDCSSNGLPLTLDRDPRLTKLGKFLMAWKLDELPQLFNVLRGEMSIIGPRPESLAFANCFSDGFEAVLEYKPGIVGPSQATFRSEADFLPDASQAAEFYRDVLFPIKALIDLKYYPNRTLMSDMLWLMVTMLMVFGIVLPIVPFVKFRRSVRSSLLPQ